MSKPRRLLARLRETMAASPAPMPELVRLVAAELVSEVCSIYALRPGEILELMATQGLKPEAVGRTRLRVGEGIVGIVAATGKPLNLPDAQNHPAFAYRPETGEEPYASMLAVPVRRAGRTLGVLDVQNRAPRSYGEDEVEVLETVAMVLAEILAAAGTADGNQLGYVSTLPRVFPATVLVSGVAIGRVVVHGMRGGPRQLLAEDPAAEQLRLDAAAEAMQRGLDRLISESLPEAEADGTRDTAASASREVLEAYRLIAADAGWLRRVSEAVRGGLTAEAAVHRVAGEVRARMRTVTDPYLRERLADLDDLAGRLLATLDGKVDGPGVDAAGAILLARRLGPAELLDWHTRGIAGLVIEEASPSGHAAIIARALGLPTLGGARGLLDAVEDDDIVVLDGDEGQLILRPNDEARRAFERAVDTRNQRQAKWGALRDSPAATADGTRVQLMLNVGLAMELGQLDATGAEGIGLFRTEIAMLARGAMSDQAEQTALYARVLDAAGDRPVVFRTLDLGSDKMLPGAPAPEEENPAMGWRSLRIGLDRPNVLRKQLRALLLAGSGRRLTVMFPMVATVAEFRTARALLRAEAQRVIPPPSHLSVGTMLEVPALLWQLPALLTEADFISVGSNDLLQFLFAADRGAPGLANRYDVLSPPVFDLLEMLLQTARAAGVPVSLCGEAAARPLEALALVGLGFTTLSMPASGILPVKAMLSGVDLPAFRQVLASIRRTASGVPSLREPIASWAREHGLAAI